MAGNELALPTTGEIIDLDDPAACTRALAGIREVEGALRDLKQTLTDAIIAESERQGTKTIHDGTFTAEVKSGSETVWDLETLEQLRTLGLPEERFNALVTAQISYKVDGRVAKQIASANEEYEKVIAAARQVVRKPSYVSIRRQV